jgi:hypothetical protein
MAQSQGYSNDNWASLSPYSQSPYNQSPLNEYGAFQYMPQSLPSESINRMAPPQHTPHHQIIQPAPPPGAPPAATQPSQSSVPMGHQQLPMLNTTWPSQLTNPQPSGSYSAPPLSRPPVSSTLPAEPPRPPAQHEKARKTLSNEQKRLMCLYHEENPGTRQADIGARFGVERSTVSKVLRQKDQFLKRDQEPDLAALKRVKGKHPDFDRTLSNYVRKQQDRGFEVKDDEIMDQAKLFARASGGQDMTSFTSNWLLKFKQKHGVRGGRLMRRASEANIPDRLSADLPKIKTEKRGGISDVSPVSPTGQPSPTSGSRSDEEAQAEGLGFDFTYRPTASHSTTSLTTDLRDPGQASFSGTTLSPSNSFNFSPDPNMGAFQMDQNLHLSSTPADFQHREKRSNTFPSLNIDFVNQSLAASNEPETPRNPTTATAPTSALESPANELQATPFAIDTNLASPPTLHRSNSNPSIKGRSNNSTMANASNDSSPISPSQEDARRAANTLLNYIQSMSSNGQFDQAEYMTVMQLTKKLQIHQLSAVRPPVGGLSRIPEGDTEMAAPAELMMESR